MRKLYLIAVSVLLATVLAGCGGSNNAGGSEAPVSEAPVSDVPSTRLAVDTVQSPGGWTVWIDHLTLADGRTIMCIEASDTGDSVSCNWEAFNAQTTATSVP